MRHCLVLPPAGASRSLQLNQDILPLPSAPARSADQRSVVEEAPGGCDSPGHGGCCSLEKRLSRLLRRLSRASVAAG